MKEYYGQISFSGRISFAVDANSEEDAKALVYDHVTMIVDSDCKDILSIEEVEWDLIDKEPQGNVSASFVSDFEIYKEE